jgi:nitrite reductase (NADH) large subunit
MLYIRTADRLQRTAPWQEAFDGGLEKLRDIVCQDILGIANDLEAAMTRHVAGYRDEWAAVLDDEDKLRRFVSFVNAPGTPTRRSRSTTRRDERSLSARLARFPTR